MSEFCKSPEEWRQQCQLVREYGNAALDTELSVVQTSPYVDGELDAFTTLAFTKFQTYQALIDNDPDREKTAPLRNEHIVLSSRHGYMTAAFMLGYFTQAYIDHCKNTAQTPDEGTFVALLQSDQVFEDQIATLADIPNAVNHIYEEELGLNLDAYKYYQRLGKSPYIVTKAKDGSLCINQHPMIIQNIYKTILYFPFHKRTAQEKCPATRVFTRNLWNALVSDALDQQIFTRAFEAATMEVTV